MRAQLLGLPRPATLLDVVRHLTLLQMDQTSALAPSADLVAWSRLGSSYAPAELAGALDDGTLLELQGMIRPREDLALYRAEMAGWATRSGLSEWEEDIREWVWANDECRRDILERLEDDGPLPASAFPDRCEVPWKSSGWNDDRNVTMLLELMVKRGEVAVAGRRGRERLWDLAERVYPDEIVPEDKAAHIRNERRLGALGIARAKGPECAVEPSDTGPVGEPAVVEGVRGTWRVDPTQLGEPFTGRAALLSPFDRLVYDRKRMLEIFEFDYGLEMYKPVGEATLGLLRAADPVWRPARGQDRRRGGPGGAGASGQRDPPGRTVHQGDGHGGEWRDQRPRALARPRPEAPSVSQSTRVHDGMRG